MKLLNLISYYYIACDTIRLLPIPKSWIFQDSRHSFPSTSWWREATTGQWWLTQTSLKTSLCV